MSVDFQPPPSDRAAAARAVKVPAIMMIVCSSLGILGAIAAIFLNKVALEAMREMHEQQQQPMPGIFEFVYGPLGTGLQIGTGLLCAVALPGSIRMLSLRSWGLSVAASICSIMTVVSCSCCGLGVVAGIWSLVVLCRPEVKAAFASTARS